MMFGVAKYVWGVWLLVIVATLLGWNLVMGFDQQYLYLSQSFLQGRVDLPEIPGSMVDVILFEGKMYWPLGLMPAIFYTPFVFVFPTFRIGFLQPLLVVLIWLLTYELARRWSGLSRYKSVLLAFGFCFGSVFLQEALTATSWHSAHVFNVLFTLLAIREVVIKKVYWRAGLWWGLATLTRFVPLVGAVFGGLMLLDEKENKIVNIVKMGLPIVGCLIVMLVYNQIRFGDFKESGHVFVQSPFITEEIREDLHKNGFFQLKNVQKNLTNYFIKLPRMMVNNSTNWTVPIFYPPQPEGVNFWIVSPIFIYIFWGDFRNKQVRYSLITSCLMLGILVMYFSSGGRQVGPRYMTDLLPYLYLILLTSFKKKNFGVIPSLLVIFGGLSNLVMYFTIGGI